MLKNYILVSLRAFRKHKLYSSLNVIGLSVGLTVVLLIGLYVRFELSYDRFGEKSDRTYRIIQTQPDNLFMGSNQFAVTPAPLEAALRDELAAVEDATQINDMRALVRTGSTSFFDSGIFATPSFLNVFDFPLLQGNRNTALDQPNSVLVTPDFAKKVFGDTDAVGKSFELGYWDDVLTVTVKGIIAPAPSNAHFHYSFILSYVGNEGRERGHWGSNSYHTYVLLRPGADVNRFGTDLQALVDRNVSELSWVKEEGAKIPYFFAQPVADVHLRSHTNFDIEDGSDIRYVWLLTLAAVIIMLTACVNYVNLATARAATRFREVGVRKVAGADKAQLIRQFIGESILVSMIATVLAVALTVLLLPAFSSLIDREIPDSMLLSVWFVAAVPLLGLVVGVLSGSYPALILSRIVPARILKSGGAMRGTRSLLRNALVVTQFAIGVVLVVGTFVVRGQLEYVREADTGIDRERVVSVRARDPELSGQWQSLRDELSRVAGVTEVSSSTDLPTNIGSSNSVDDWDGHQDDQEMTFYVAGINYNYPEMLGLEFVEGRSFSPDHLTDDENGLILNRTAVRQLGWDTAVGKKIEMGTGGATVVGVVEDFQFHSAHLGIMPLALHLEADGIWRILVKVAPDDIPDTINRIETVFTGFSPDYPFEYQFLDDAYNSMYRTEQRLGMAFTAVTALALLIACLGLFGLAAFMALQRTKEIGVRKVLGAGLPDIVLLLSLDFGRLVLIAFVVGSPIAYFVMRRWLERFAYHIDIGAAIFIGAGLLMATAAMITVGYHSIKASRMDPVKALRYE